MIGGMLATTEQPASAGTRQQLNKMCATTLIFLAPITALGASSVSIGIVGGLALTPLLLIGLRSYRGAWQIVVVWVAALLTAPLVAYLALQDPGRELDFGFALRITALFAGGAVLLMLLLWGRKVIGDRAVILAFAGGTLVQAIATPTSWAGDPWKFAFAWPVSLIALSLVTPRLRLPALLGLVVVSVVYDFRSFAGLCLLAAALVLWRTRAKPDAHILRPLILAVVAAFALLQIGTWAALDGKLGEEIQYRTFNQTDGGKQSVLKSARPESAATLSLMKSLPIGYGPGLVPSAQDVDIAKAGLYSVNAATAGGYVDDYMFANRIELHSVAADWWVLFGPFGLLLGAITGVRIAATLARRVAGGALAAGPTLIAIVGLWDLLFSPIASNSTHVILALALAIPLRSSALRR